MIRKSTNYKYTESVFCKSTSLSFRDPKKFSHIMRATREREIFQTSTAWNNQSRLGLTPKHPSIAQKCCLVGFGPNSLVIHTNQQEADQQWEKPPLCAPLCFVGNVGAPLMWLINPERIENPPESDSTRRTCLVFATAKGIIICARRERWTCVALCFLGCISRSPHQASFWEHPELENPWLPT